MPFFSRRSKEEEEAAEQEEQVRRAREREAWRQSRQAQQQQQQRHPTPRPPAQQQLQNYGQYPPTDTRPGSQPGQNRPTSYTPPPPPQSQSQQYYAGDSRQFAGSYQPAQPTFARSGTPDQSYQRGPYRSTSNHSLRATTPQQTVDPAIHQAVNAAYAAGLAVGRHFAYSFGRATARDPRMARPPSPPAPPYTLQAERTAWLSGFQQGSRDGNTFNNGYMHGRENESMY